MNVRQWWLCVVKVENPAGMIDEYDIKPDRKLYLEDFLDIVKEQINAFEDINGTYWQVDIYRLTGHR